MATVTKRNSRLHLRDFAIDAHAAKYRAELDAHPVAVRRLLEILNDPAHEQRLVDAEMHGLPALAGVVRYVESDPDIGLVLHTGIQSNRFRQTVGVAVKLKMAKLGWIATGRKGSVRGALHFTKSEHYEPQGEVASHDAQRALAALDRVLRIGDDEERGETGRFLTESLAAARASEGRPF
jgi:hypothetical protein